MKKRTRAITLAALFSALCVVSLYFASVWPTGQIGIVAFASLFVAAAVIEAGPLPGVNVFVVSSVLGMLILPNKSAQLLYMLFFGYYPIIKYLVERIPRTLIQWALKILIFNISLTVIWFLIGGIFFSFGENPPSATIMYLCGNAVFVLFDYGFSSAIWFYINTVSKNIKKG